MAAGRRTRRARFFHAAIRIDRQPVTQITIVEPESGKEDEALSLMTERAHFMARQPGFISISLHRSLDRKCIVNYIRWQRPRSAAGGP